jgi:undecaprenyl-diphosphatase
MPSPTAHRTPRVWRFLVARLDPHAYLGLHLTLGLLICVLALWAFGALLDALFDRGAMVRRDLALATWFHTHATPFGDRAFSAVSLVGSPAVMTALGVAVAIYLLYRHERPLLLAWAIALVGGTVLDTTLKDVIRRPRPEYAMQFLHGTSWSFPSGHSLGSLVGYGMLAYIVIRLGHLRDRRARAAIWSAAILLVLAIGFSRLYLAVHFLSDVMAGFAAGALWLAACLTGLVLVRHRAEFRRATSLPPAPPASPTAAS